MSDFFNWPEKTIKVREELEIGEPSPEEHFPSKAGQVIFRGYINWEERQDFRKEWPGYPTLERIDFTGNSGVAFNDLVFPSPTSQFPNTPPDWHQLFALPERPVDILHRVTPAYHPDYPNNNAPPFVGDINFFENIPNPLWCEEVNMIGFEPQGQQPNKFANYKEAKVRASFQNRSYRILSDQLLVTIQQAAKWNNPTTFPALPAPFNNPADKPIDGTYPPNYPDEATLLRYVTVKYYPRQRFQTIPPTSGAQWNSYFDITPGSPGVQDAGPATAVTAVSFVEGDYHVTWHQVPLECVPYAAWDNCMGKTNRYLWGCPTTGVAGRIYKPLGGTRNPGTLFCLQPEFADDPYLLANGTFGVDIVYRFHYYPFGVNTFWKWYGKTFPGGVGFGQQTFDGNIFHPVCIPVPLTLPPAAVTYRESDRHAGVHPLTGHTLKTLVLNTGNINYTNVPKNPKSLIIQTANFNDLFRPARPDPAPFPPGESVAW